MALGAATRIVDGESNLDAANLNPLDGGLNVYHSPNGGLNFRVTAGHVWLKRNGAPTLFTYAGAASDQAVSPGTTTYVYLDQTGALQASSSISAFPAVSVPLAVVTSDGSAITAISDRRPRAELPGAADARLWRSGRFYTNRREAPTSTVSLTADTLYGIPFHITGDTPVDRISFEVTTADAGSAIRLGLYAESTSVPGEPGALLEDLGTISSATTGMKTLTISPTRRLGPGRYFVALIASSGIVAFRAHAASAELGWPGGTSDLQQASLETTWKGSDGGNDEAVALPDPFPATPTATLTTYPAPALRAG